MSSVQFLLIFSTVTWRDDLQRVRCCWYFAQARRELLHSFSYWKASLQEQSKKCFQYDRALLLIYIRSWPIT